MTARSSPMFAFQRLGTVSLVVLSLLLAAPGAAQRTSDYSVQVSAVVQADPARITLSWPRDSAGTPTGYRIARRTPGATTWEAEVELAGSTTTYTDSTVRPGTAYEYQIRKIAATHTGYGYIQTGIGLPLVEGRGRVVLIVDATKADALAPELDRLEWDLAGDGWIVARHDVQPGDSVTDVKAIIRSEYLSDPQKVRAVFLLGRVPVPYSGQLYPDGHPDHQGAWPADVYYGDMEGVWTDATVRYTQTLNGEAAERARLTNMPGDGKFDQTTVPGRVVLQVGRVDFHDMPGRPTPGGPGVFPSETELLRRYLEKDHAFRHGRMTASRRGIIGDFFGARNGLAFAASGFRSFAPLFGPENIVERSGAKGAWMTALRNEDFLWAYGCGGGSYTYADGLGSTTGYFGMSTEMVSNDPRAVFYMLFGSWFGDWDHEDNLMRAALAAPSYGLACAWSGIPHWFFHPMGMGETLGYCAQLTQNNRTEYQTATHLTGGVHVALLGDPTLRLHVVPPPENVSAAPEAGGGVTVTWAASDDPDVIGYDVYRGSGPSAGFVRLTETPVFSGNRFTVSSPRPNDTYQVRAIKLEQTPSGSYFNASQGVFTSTAAPVFTRQPVAISGSIGGAATLTAEVTASASYQWEKNGVAIAGATGPTLTVIGLTEADAGSYCLVARNAWGTTRSDPVVLSVEARKVGRLINLSARAFAGTGDQTLIVGFTLAGNGDKPMLVRGVGSTLSAVGVEGALPNPRIDLFRGSEWLLGNASWRMTENRDAVMAISGHTLGSLVLDDREALLLRELPVGGYTAHLRDEEGGTGVALFDVLDPAVAEPGTADFDAQPRLINLSVRAFAGTGSHTLIAGFIINGNASRRVLVRGIGPVLAHFGVGGVLSNPKLRLFRGQRLLQELDDWSTASNHDDIIAARAHLLGSEPLASTDAVLLITLEPGAYTVHLVGATGGTGVALLEINDAE